MTDRAVLFIDGNNWYHSLKEAGVGDLGRLNYAKISEKLIGPRMWVSTRYYIGQLKQQGNVHLYAEQRSFLSGLQKTDARISVHLGRLGTRPALDPAADELSLYLANLKTRIDPTVFRELGELAARHRRIQILVEKAVDVMIAVDLTLLAVEAKYDAAYLLSADGDLTPAVAAARQLGKKVYVASPARGAQIAAAANSFIQLKPDWFDDCF